MDALAIVGWTDHLEMPIRKTNSEPDQIASGLITWGDKVYAFWSGSDCWKEKTMTTVEKQTAAGERAADSPNPIEQQITAELRERHLPISGLHLPGFAGIWEWPDDDVLRFVCEQIHQERCHLADIALESNDAKMQSEIAELLHMAGAVAAQKPPCENLWGILQVLKLDNDNVLAQVCLHLYKVSRAIIQKSRQHYTNPLDQVGLAHALVAAEQLVQREGIATDLEGRKQDHKPTLVQQWAWTVTTKLARQYLRCASEDSI